MDRVRKRDRFKNFTKRVFGGSSDILEITESLTANFSPDAQTGPDSASETQSAQDLATNEQTDQDSSADAQIGQDGPPDTLPSPSITPASFSDSAQFLAISFLELILEWIFLGIWRWWKHQLQTMSRTRVLLNQTSTPLCPQFLNRHLHPSNPIYRNHPVLLETAKKHYSNISKR